MRKSVESSNAINDICEITGNMKVSWNNSKSLIRMNVGDPTFYGNLKVPDHVNHAVSRAIASAKFNGYGPPTGFPEAREAVAKLYASPDEPISSEDVFMASGCSHALEMAFAAIANRGDQILLPRPGSCQYKTKLLPRGIEPVLYDLDSSRDWEVDLDVRSKIGRQTAALLLCNPSNPCGSVFSKQHLEDILDVAEEHKIPIISDEIYGNITFGDSGFYSLPTLTPKVPTIVCSSLSKSYLVPGWRLGWAVVFDRHGVLADVKDGMRKLTQIILGPCGIIQGALPDILANSCQQDFQNISNLVKQNAEKAFSILSSSSVLHPIMPSGAIYMIVKIDINALKGICNDLDFMTNLLLEESVWILPGKCFDYPDSFRMVLLPPTHMVEDGCQRIVEFCERITDYDFEK